MPGQKLCEEDFQKINRNFLCTVCGWLLKEPHQTRCGHLVCSTCISQILNSSNSVCPIDGSILTQQDFFADQFTKRELQSLTLHCENEDCVWEGKFKELEDHYVNSCEHALIKCVHDQCTKDVKRCLLSNHLESECEYRLVSCQYCNKEITITLLENHLDAECLAVPVTCKYCYEKLPRGQREKHEKILCENRLVKCGFIAIGCSHNEEMKVDKSRNHETTGLLEHVQLLLMFILEISASLKNMIPRKEILEMIENTFNELKVATEFLKNESTKLIKNLSLMTERVTGLEKKVKEFEKKKPRNKYDDKMNHLEENIKDFKEKNSKLEKELHQVNSLNRKLNTKLEQMDESLTMITLKLSDLESSNSSHTFISRNGTLLWKIDGFKRKRENAVNGTQRAISSPHFYSSEFGYKMCAKVYLNGDGFGKNTHISLFFVVMKGEYDSLLTWPFQKKITMMLLDQNTGEHMIDSFPTDPDSSSFQQPQNTTNIASGSPLFVDLKEINERAGFVKDDTLFIKIIVH